MSVENSELKNDNIYASLPQSEKNQKLIDSAFRKKIKELGLLLAAGAEVDSPRSDGETALTISAENGCTEAVDVLIRAGANLETKSQSGQSVLSGSVKKNRIRTTTLLFSAMTQEQVNNAILFEGLANTPSIFSERTISRYFEKFKQIVIAHRMAIFKKLGPLFLDSNPKNEFPALLPELQEAIVLDYCEGTSNESWQHFHSVLDAKAICNAISKNAPPKEMSEIPINVDEELANAMSQIKITVEEAKVDEEKQKKPKKNKTRNKYNLSNYSPKRLRKSPQHSEEELSLEEAMSQLEISPKEAKQKNKYNPLTFSPKLFRKKSKKSQESRSSDDAVTPTDTTTEEEKSSTENKKKSRYAFLGK